MKNNKKAAILVYVLFLVSLSLVFASIILKNNSYLFNIDDYYNIDTKLYSNIIDDWKKLVDMDRQFNSNWWWFVDSVACPGLFTVTMSGSTNKDIIWTNIVNSGGSIHCEWYYFWNLVKLYFDSEFTDIEQAEYMWSTIWITYGIWDTPFSDGDTTVISFALSSFLTTDSYDDDFDSDNYSVTSTWTIYYPGSYVDDDNLGRKTLFGYADLDSKYKKIFWNSSSYTQIIDVNTNNDDSFNEKIWNVWSWVLNLEVDKNANLLLAEFDKSRYDNDNELVVIDTLYWAITSGSWYIQNTAWALSLSPTITWDEYNFDFVNKSYWLFLQVTSPGTLLYKLKWETDTWKDIYIVPIDDSEDWIIKYHWNDIVRDADWLFIPKEKDLIYDK